jgi:hypothetical protein
VPSITHVSGLDEAKGSGEDKIFRERAAVRIQSSNAEKLAAALCRSSFALACRPLSGYFCE